MLTFCRPCGSDTANNSREKNRKLRKWYHPAPRLHNNQSERYFYALSRYNELQARCPPHPTASSEESSRKSQCIGLPRRSVPAVSSCNAPLVVCIRQCCDRRGKRNWRTQAPVDKEVPVTEQVWNLIDVFLSKRDGLATSRDVAIKSWAVYEAAERMLKEGIGGFEATAASSNGVQCGQLSPVPSTPLLRTDKLSSPTRSVGVGTSVNISTTRSDQQHGQQSQYMNSWRLVTTLLGRQNEVTQKDTQLVGEPHQPLVAALNSKLEELRLIYKGLVDDRSSVDGERMSDGLVQFSLEDEDLATKLECKIRLWSLLLSSVQGVVGAH